jgi:hypothetical protein
MAENNQMSFTVKGAPEHIDDMVTMLRGGQAQAVAGTPSMAGLPPAPPAATAAPALGSGLLGVVPAAGAIEAAGTSPLPPVSPLGQRPGPPLLSRIGHGLKIAGEIAGTAFVPRIMPWIPGTPQHNLMEQEIAEQQKSSEAERGLKGAQSELYKAEAYKDLHPAEKTATGQARATVVSGGQAYEWNPDTEKYDIPVGKPSQKAELKGQWLMDTQLPNQQHPVWVTHEQLTANPERYYPAAKPTSGTDVNTFIDKWLEERKLPDIPENWAAAHKAYTKETKVDPGVIRIEALGDVRGPQVYDTISGQTTPMPWNQLKDLQRRFPGRYVSTQDPEAAGAIAAGRAIAPKNVGTQAQSYGTFVRHAGDLYSVVNDMKNTNSPFLNRPINWLRTNTGDPRVRVFLAKLDPAMKEFESFLLNNRALYDQDRKDADQILNENATPAQMFAVIPSLIHTGSIRLDELNTAYRRATGKDVPNLVSPEAQKIFKQLNVAGPGGQGAPGQPAGGKAPTGTKGDPLGLY